MTVRWQAWVQFWRVAALIAIIFGGSAVWWGYLQSAPPCPQVSAALIGCCVHAPLANVTCTVAIIPVSSDAVCMCRAATAMDHVIEQLLICQLTGQMPDVYHDPNGRVFLMTKGKEKVSVAQDQFGNVFMFDRNGNLYYDTGDKSFGMLVVRSINTWLRL